MDTQRTAHFIKEQRTAAGLTQKLFATGSLGIVLLCSGIRLIIKNLSVINTDNRNTVFLENASAFLIRLTNSDNAV